MPAIGTMTCLVCGRDVVARKNKGDAGALSISCQHCDVTIYAKASTEARRLLEAKVKPYAPPAGAPAPAKPAAAAAGDKPAKMPWER